MRVLKGEGKKKKAAEKKIIKEIMAGKFPSLLKNINLPI